MMLTENQLRAEFYNAIESYVPLTWIGKPAKSDSFPIAQYRILDDSGVYVVGLELTAEDRSFQLDVYADHGDMAQLDGIMDSVKTALTAIGYRKIGSTAEFVDAELNKVVRVTRWERYNV